ncbi:MAG: leucine-rich repeat protein [Clostridia bacterium]|nr:leucine-rich repeat protein [Clostridia bacterium]
MNKKTRLTLLLSALCCLLAFAACEEPVRGETGTESVENTAESASEEHVHEYSEQVVAPTCTEQGYTVYTCTVCGNTYNEDYTEKLGHNYVDGVCTRCEEEITSESFNFILNAYRTGYLVGGLKGNQIDVVIPSSYRGLPVTAIASSAFYNCKNIKSVVVPESVENIYAKAFYGCSALTKVTLTKGIKSIGEEAFSYCDKLTTINLPDSLVSIGNYAFFRCRIARVKIPEGITAISEGMFQACSVLSKVEMHDGITEICNAAFMGCGFEEVEVPGNVKSIGKKAFFSCESLKSVVVSEGVVSIGEGAFSACEVLKSVKLPNSLAEIGNYVFLLSDHITYNKYEGANYIGNDDNPYVVFMKTARTTVCKINDRTKFIQGASFFFDNNLEKVVISESVISIGEDAFYGCNNIKGVYYLGNAEEWAKIVMAEGNEKLTEATRYYYSEEKPTEEGDFWHYDESGNVVEWEKV